MNAYVFSKSQTVFLIICKKYNKVTNPLLSGAKQQEKK